MESYSEEGNEQFFDTREDICSVSDLGSDDCSSSVDFDYTSSQYEFWIKKPESVNDRRRRFFKWLGLSLDRNSIAGEELGNESFENSQLGMDRITVNSRAELRTSGVEDSYLSNQSLMLSQSIEDPGLFENGALDENFVYKIRNLDDGTEFVVDEIDQDGKPIRLHEVGTNQSLSFEDFERTIGLSPFIQLLSSGYVNEVADKVELKKKGKRSWLTRLSCAARTVDRHAAVALKPNDIESTVREKMRRVRVYPSKKQSKELSSLYAGQEFLAHKGSILTMKFSLDGQYLASGGEDGVVRVWKVIEDDRLDQFDISASDPSCLYFTMNHLSELSFLDVDKEKIGNIKRHKSSDSTCIIFPPKVFRVLEKPMHEFQGHSDEVLGLSWSNKRFLLSSSADKTVRLWQVGCDRCLRVFSHSNYVTCVGFNPADDNYFISGSIDGKVRIWEVIGCRVVDYTDIRDIITAVCYHPGGKGAIVGSMTGNCLFYDIIDNRLQLDTQICLQGKKKLPGKRITGFEFSPSDPSKVVVTSADSLVRVLCGMDVVCKFKVSGLGIAANQMFAGFTSDGKHIVSTSEDSNVYIWNYTNRERLSSRAKNVQSCESFVSQNASFAIPWFGIKPVSGTLSPASSGDIHGHSGNNEHNHQKFYGELDNEMLPTSSHCFSQARGFLLEALTRVSATWPEEKLPDSSPAAVSRNKHKSEYKFLRSACRSMFNSSHMWGLVIVTAGWDGRIRTYLNYGLPLRL